MIRKFKLFIYLLFLIKIIGKDFNLFRECFQRLGSASGVTEWHHDSQTDPGNKCKIVCQTSENFYSNETYHVTLDANDGAPCSIGWNAGLCIGGICRTSDCSGNLSIEHRKGTFIPFIRCFAKACLMKVF